MGSCVSLTGDFSFDAAAVAVLLGGTGADCVLACCSTAVWLTYGVVGTAGCGRHGDGVCGGPCCVCSLCGMDLLSLDDCDPVDPFVVSSKGSKSNLSSGCSGDTCAVSMG